MEQRPRSNRLLRVRSGFHRERVHGSRDAGRAVGDKAVGTPVRADNPVVTVMFALRVADLLRSALLQASSFSFRLSKRSKLHLSAGGVMAVVAITMTTTAENTL